MECIESKKVILNPQVILPGPREAKEPNFTVGYVSANDLKGGAQKVAWALKQGLKQREFQTKMFVGQKFSNDPDVKIITDAIADSSKHYTDQGYMYYDINSTFELVSQSEFIGCDVVHYHNLHGNYFNPFALPGLTESKPSVWTLHDMQGMTGHCAYAFDCDKWQRSCGNCLHPESYPPITKDLTAEMWRDKKLIYKESDFELIAPSQWLKNIIPKSILKDKKIHLIYNGIDERVYRPLDRQAIRRMFKIPQNAVIIGFVAHGGIIDERKGGKYILEAYRYFTAKYPNAFFICIGGTSNRAPTERFLQIPFVLDEEKLVQLYCASDIFLFPTLADNCPLIVLELMGCGVPLVSFDIGGVPELIEHNRTGFIAGYKNTEEFVKMAEHLVLDKSKREQFSKAGLERLQKMFTLDRMIDRHIALYEHLAEQGKKKNYIPTKSKVLLSATTCDKQYKYLVSAIVSTYNSEKFIRGCLEDLENQTIADKLEIIVINSGSQQNEEAIVLEFQSRYDNIKYIRTEERETIYKAWNRAIKVAAGKYITNANTDDRHAPHMLERLVVELERNEDIAAVYSHFYVTTVENQTWETKTPDRVSTWNPPYSREGLLERYFLGPQPMWRKSLHDEYGYFDDSCKVGGDYEFFLRASQTHDFLLIPEQLGLYLLSDNSLERSATTKDQECQWIQNLYRNNTDRIVRRPFLPSEIKTTAFILTVGDPAFEYCKKAIARQTNQNFKVNIIQNVSPLSAADQEMINRCDTEYFIKVDEDMILHPDAVEKMQAVMDAAPDNIGMVCFLLYDEDRESNIQGIKIFRTSDVKDLRMQNIRANDMNLTEQMGQKGIKWVAHPDVVGRHGTIYTPETIYRRYKAMYENNISVWNCLQSDMRKKADKYHRTGNPLELFALLGAAHGIINIPHIKECQGKDAKEYCLKELDTFKRLLLADSPACMPYEPGGKGKVFLNEPLNFEQVQWKKTPTPKNNSKSTSYLKPPARKAAKSLSILHTVEFYYPHIGGAEIVVQELSERLVKRGHRVTVATTKLADRTFAELNGVQIEEFDVRGGTTQGLTGSDIDRYQQFLLKHPADIMMNYAAQQWATDLAFDTLSSTGNRRINIIAPCGYSALSDSKTLQYPQFADYFNKVIPTYLPKYDAARYHSGLYQDYEFAQNHGFANSVIIPNGICEEEFLQTPKVAFRQKYNITTKYMGLCVANFYKGKGQEKIIECVRQMNRPDFTIVFIGKEGGELGNLYKLVSGLNVRFCVGIEREDTLAAYHEADIFLFGSEKECSPLVIVEAKASRTPFVSTDCGNVREWKGGVVCAPEKMALYANRILDDELVLRALAEEGWKEWKEKLTWELVIDKFEELYLRLHFEKFGRIQRTAWSTLNHSVPKQLQEALNAKQAAGAKGFV